MEGDRSDTKQNFWNVGKQNILNNNVYIDFYFLDITCVKTHFKPFRVDVTCSFRYFFLSIIYIVDKQKLLKITIIMYCFFLVFTNHVIIFNIVYSIVVTYNI